MKIKFLSGLAGTDAAGALILFGAGDVVDWNDEEAGRLILAGIADEVVEPAYEKPVVGSGPRKISSRQPADRQGA